METAVYEPNRSCRSEGISLWLYLIVTHPMFLQKKLTYAVVPLLCLATLALTTLTTYRREKSRKTIMPTRFSVVTSAGDQLIPRRGITAGENLMNKKDDFLRRILAEQEERKSKVSRECRKTGHRVVGNVEPRLAFHFINIRSLGMTYVALPKCASTMLKGYFERISGVDCGSQYHEHVCASKHFVATKEKALEPFTLLVVRNPWTRLVSSYTDKFLVERHPITSDCYAYHGMDLHGTAISFSQFVACILHKHSTGQPINDHVAPIHWMCSPCQRKYSYIAKVETISEDIRYLSKYMFPKNITAEHYSDVFSNNYRRPHENDNATLRHYEASFKSLSKEAYSALVKIYRPDAELFGYPKTPI